MIDSKVIISEQRLIKKLVLITKHFNYIVCQASMAEYEKICEIFGLSITDYESKKAIYKPEERPFKNLMTPTIYNVGINDDRKVFSYFYSFSKPAVDDCILKIDYIINLETALFNTEKNLQLLDSYKKYMSTEGFIKCITEEVNIMERFRTELNAEGFTEDELYQISQVLSQNIMNIRMRKK